MIYLHALRLQDYASFKDVTFKIKKGLTTIYGLNQASGSNDNNNGVGKSALFAAIPEVIHEDPIIGEKSDRTKTGTKSLSWTTSKGDRIAVQRAEKGKGESISVRVNGKDKELRTSPIAKAFIRKSFPITASDYSTYVHLDSRIPHPLVMGSTAERKGFFTKFFNLDKIDAERKLYVAELAGLKRTRAAFNELRTQYDRLKEQLLSPEDLDKYTALELKYKKQVSALRTEFSDIQETLRLIQFAQSSVEQIKELKNACGGDITEEAFEELEKQNRFDLKDTAEKLEHAENWEQYQRDSRAYDKAYEGLSPLTKKWLAKYGLDRLRERAGLNYEKRLEISDKLKKLALTMSECKSVMDEGLPPKISTPEEDVGDLETLRRAYKHQLEHAQKFKQGKCETCGQIVKIKDPEVLRQKLESVVKKLNQHQKAEKYNEARKLQQKAAAGYKAAKSEYVELSAEEERLLKWQKVHREVRDIPEQPKPFKGLKLQLAVCKRMMEEVKDRKSLLQYMRPHLETILEFLSLDKKDVQRARNSEDLNERMNEAQNKWSRVQAKIEIHRTLKDQVLDMRSRLKTMKEQLAEEEPLKHLVQGYQDKNIKKMAIEAISQRLMVLVNKYAQMVLPEKFTFEFVWDSQIRLLVHRHYGKKVKTSDVRKLSGAESTLFTLILVCALLAFVPSHKRCNVLILDEPAARLSKRLREVFKNMLVILNQLIPSIIVITPHDEVYEGAHCFTVVKDRRGEATIVEGKPQDIIKVKQA